MIPRSQLVPVDGSTPQTSLESKPAASAVAPRRLTTTSTPTSNDQPGLTSHAYSLRELSEEPPVGTLAPLDEHSLFDSQPIEIYAKKSKRRAGGWSPWIRNSLVMLLAIAAVGSLFGIIIVLGRSSDNEAEHAKSGGNNASADSPKADPQPDTKFDSPDRRDPVEHEETVDESPTFFSSKQWRSVWQKVNPYLVQLKIESPLEERIVTGLLVDSRGWVATSYRSIRDAGRVRATVAGKNLNDTPPLRDLTDDARGVIATDPDHDLALISINRAQVLSLVEVTISQRDNLVPSQRCLIGRVPPPRHQKWLTECRFSRRATFDQLPDAEKDVVRRQGLDADDSIEWIIHPADAPGKKSPQIIGSPIFDDQGLVVAYNTSLSADGHLLALPAKHIKKLIDSVTSDQPQAFAKSGELQQMAAGDTEFSNDGGSDELRRQTSDIVRNLKSSFEKCRATGWTASSRDEYDAFQSLAENWIKLHQLSQQYRDDRRIGGPIEAELQNMMELISSSLVDDVDEQEFAEGQGNQWFATSVNRVNPWFVVLADVHQTAGSSPQIDGQPTIGLQLVGIETKVVSPYIEDYKNLVLGKRFILFGRLDPREIMLSRNADNSERTRVINIMVYVEMPK